MSEDRSNPPAGLDLGFDERAMPSCGEEYVYFAEDGMHHTDDEAIAAAWAFVDRIRAEERERIAELFRGIFTGNPAFDGLANHLDDDDPHYLAPDAIAEWLRAGAKGEP